MQGLAQLLLRFNDSLKRSATVYMVMVAAIIGVLGGYGAVGFRYLIKTFEELIWRSPNLEISWIETLPTWQLLVIPAVGGLVVGMLVHFFAQEAKGHGVPEVMEAVARRGGSIRPRVVAVKALASSLCIASGGSVGREGPIIQIGSAVGSTVGQILRVSPRRLRTLVGCGAAAGMAATFNAPVAGALFAVEVILGDFGVPQFSPIVISSVMATMVSRHFLGDFPAYIIPEYSLVHPMELLGYAALGVLAGLVSLLFMHTLEFFEDRFDGMKMALPFRTALGGLGVGLVALVGPGVLGVGHEEVNNALLSTSTMGVLAALLGYKLLAVCLTLGSGGSGGIFAPSLFLGAMLGGLVGQTMQMIMPGMVAPPGAYALVGMGTVVAATTHAPITAILILFEMTNDYHIMLPLMTACIIGTLVSSRLFKESIYTIKLSRRGVNVRAGQDINILRSIPVKEIVNQDAPVLSPYQPLQPMLAELLTSQDSCLYVVNDQRKLVGVISMNELRPVLADVELLQGLVVAGDVAATDWPTVSETENLDEVLKRLDMGYRDEMPVVEDGVFVGAVRMSGVLDRYKKELFKHEMAGTMAVGMEGAEGSSVLRRVGEYVVAEIEPPPRMHGKRLADTDLRSRFGLNVLLIRPGRSDEGRPATPILPDADSVLSAQDRLLVFGREEQVRRLGDV
jgi:CIC family chloride channel protein